MHMPQTKKSLALIYAVNPFGADHQSSEHDWMYEEGTSDLYLKRLAMIGLKTRLRLVILVRKKYALLTLPSTSTAC